MKRKLTAPGSSICFTQAHAPHLLHPGLLVLSLRAAGEMGADDHQGGAVNLATQSGLDRALLTGGEDGFGMGRSSVGKRGRDGAGGRGGPPLRGRAATARRRERRRGRPLAQRRRHQPAPSHAPAPSYSHLTLRPFCNRTRVRTSPRSSISTCTATMPPPSTRFGPFSMLCTPST